MTKILIVSCYHQMSDF